MPKDLMAEAQPKLQKAFDYLVNELKTIRTGRANTATVEDIEVEAYSQPMPLKALASITTPDAKSITITPWDGSNLEPVEKAIRENKDLGLNPVNDGKALHINVPPLTAESREQLVKQVGEKVESCYVSLRNTRHEVLNEAKDMQKKSELGEDDYHRVEKQITGKIDELRQRIEELAENKRQELREF